MPAGCLRRAMQNFLPVSGVAASAPALGRLMELPPHGAPRSSREPQPSLTRRPDRCHGNGVGHPPRRWGRSGNDVGAGGKRGRYRKCVSLASQVTAPLGCRHLADSPPPRGSCSEAAPLTHPPPPRGGLAALSVAIMPAGPVQAVPPPPPVATEPKQVPCLPRRDPEPGPRPRRASLGAGSGGRLAGGLAGTTSPRRQRAGTVVLRRVAPRPRQLLHPLGV